MHAVIKQRSFVIEVFVDFFGIISSLEDVTDEKLQDELESGRGRHPKWSSLSSDENFQSECRSFVHLSVPPSTGSSVPLRAGPSVPLSAGQVVCAPIGLSVAPSAGPTVPLSAGPSMPSGSCPFVPAHAVSSRESSTDIPGLTNSKAPPSASFMFLRQSRLIFLDQL